MTGASVIAAAWPEWEVVRDIGEGTFGAVFEVRRRDVAGFTAAVKIIPVPTDRGDIEALRADGFREEEIEKYLGRLAEDWLGEIQIMKRYQGTSHFVSIEDCRILPRTDGIPGRWILIRMEMLKSLNEYLSDKTLTEVEVTDLGLQLCAALSVCHADGVLHRDIKPGNIFVNDRLRSGVVYKLGDFGASRKMEYTTGSQSVKGALAYMAPEVIQKQRYDRRADIYSLGLTMYRLLNGSRLPFLPARNLFTHEDHAVAMRMRLMGTPLPDAADASEAMNRVLRKACAADPEERYPSADAFAEALREVQRGPVPKRERKDGRKNRLRIAAVCAAVVLLGAAVWLIARPSCGGPRKGEQRTPPPMLVVFDRRTKP